MREGHSKTVMAMVRAPGRVAIRALSTTSKALKGPTNSSESIPQHLDIARLPKFAYDDVDVAVHLDLEHQRQRLHFRRLINYQLPALKKYQEEYIPPDKSHCVQIQRQERWDMDDPHREETDRVVSIEVKVTDLPLSSDAAQHKFRVLAGDKLDAKKDTFEVECETFPLVEMNESWCSDVLDKLIAESEKQEDSLADVPVDERATYKKYQNLRYDGATIDMFPKEWLPKGPDSQRKPTSS